MQIEIRRLREDVPLPEYKTAGAVAFDLAVIEGATLAPGERTLLPTGLVIRVPEGHALILASRSSNAKKGIRLSNSIGVIDQDYSGPEDELKIAVHNFGAESYTIEKYDRIAQGLIMPIARATFTEPQEWGGANRGGFGTTG